MVFYTHSQSLSQAALHCFLANLKGTGMIYLVHILPFVRRALLLLLARVVVEEKNIKYILNYLLGFIVSSDVKLLKMCTNLHHDWNNTQ